MKIKIKKKIFKKKTTTFYRMNTCIKCKIWTTDMITKYNLCYYCYMGYEKNINKNIIKN